MSGQGTDSWSSACNARDNGQTDGTSTVIIQQGCIREKYVVGKARLGLYRKHAVYNQAC